MSYIVRIHPMAERDFIEQFDYIAERSFEGAVRWEDAFEAMKIKLADNPFVYGYAAEEPYFKRELRSAPFKTKQGNTYFAMYVVQEKEVTILRVRGEGQPVLTKADLPNG